jgi:hypothetical protein
VLPVSSGRWFPLRNCDGIPAGISVPIQSLHLSLIRLVSSTFRWKYVNNFGYLIRVTGRAADFRTQLIGERTPAFVSAGAARARAGWTELDPVSVSFMHQMCGLA